MTQADPILSAFRLTNPLLLIALGFLIGGFAAINKYGKLTGLEMVITMADDAASPIIAPEPMHVGDHVVDQKKLYTGLFIIGTSP